jgi:hypothetical protein
MTSRQIQHFMVVVAHFIVPDTFQTRWSLSFRRLYMRGKVKCVTAWPLKMGPMGCPETSVTTNQLCVTSQQNEDLI